MKPERWQQLDQLFHSALERTPAERAAFLDGCCAGDESLRKQVDALLASHEEAGSFIEKPALEVEARSFAIDQEAPIAGQTIGHYKIITSIGAGGMGEVYLAQDMHLGRKVALKLLPVDFTRDMERVRRFQQEARAASSLNHPNIITIHEIGQAQERHFIATEFIDGQTLREYLKKLQSQSVTGGNHTGLQLTEALSITMQVADALSAAHAKGIVHRDIKPENIILVKDKHLMQRNCIVKVLDFGIAKLMEQDPGIEGEATTKVMLDTHAGSIIGTARHMSPEQARGESVDARTDIWSLGVVFYEMLTGSIPFEGNTSQDVIASILKEEAPPISNDVPDRFRWVVEKALRKNREERYQTAREMFSDLRVLQRHETETTPTTERAAHIEFTGNIKSHLAVRIVLATALVLAVAGISFAIYEYLTRNQSPPIPKHPPFQTMNMEKLTGNGKVTDAAISPDGKYIVHVKEDGVQQSLWLRQVSAPSDVQIIPPADVSYFGLTFSPSGDYLYYNTWDKRNPSSLYQMSVLPGTPRRLIVDIDSVVTFSPDGKQIAFLRGYPKQGELAVMVAKSDGTAERKLITLSMQGDPSRMSPAWSPDGKIIVYPVNNSDASGSFATLVGVDVTDGSEKEISSQQWSRIERLAWLNDGSGLLFTARKHLASPSQIWYVSHPGAEVHRVTNDLNDYISVSLTSDSATLVTVESEQNSNVWISPIDNVRHARQISNSEAAGAEGISWTPTGKIVYAAQSSGQLDLWMVEADGTGKIQLTANSGNNRRPSVSADGRYVVFVSDRTGTDHVWRIDIDGSNPRQLTNRGYGEWDPQCSPNGQWVFYQFRFGKQDLWKVPIDGGEPIQIVDKASGALAISPDGTSIATAYFDSPTWKTAIYSIEGGEPKKILDISSSWIRWTPDGRSLLYLDQRSSQNLSSQPVNGGAPSRSTDFTSERVFSFALSNDGQRLAMSRGMLTHDVVLIRNFRNQQ